MARTSSRLDAADQLAGKAQTQRIDAKRAAHVAELQACLLRYANEQVERLAAAPRA